MIGVSVDSKKNSDSIAIELSSPVEPKMFKLKEPDRLVIDLKDTFWDGGKKILDVVSDRISSVRWAQNSVHPDNVRVVVDLKMNVAHEVATENNGNKIIVRFGNPGDSSSVIERSPSPEAANILAATIESSGRKAIELSVSKPESVIEEEKTEISLSPYSKEIIPSSRIKSPPFAKLKTFSVYVNGKKMNIGRKPVFVKNTLMVPAVGFLSFCGFETSFDKKIKTLTARQSTEVEVRMTSGSNIITVNGKERTMQAAVQKKAGKLFIPLIPTAKWAGLGAVWDKGAKALYISPRITKISWEDVGGTKSVLMTASSKVPTFETEEKDRPMIFVLKIPNFILDVDTEKISVKEDGIKGIKSFQSGGDIKVGIYLEEKQASRIMQNDKQIIISFPPMVTAVTFTEESESVKIKIASTKPVLFETRRLSDPERIIIDIPEAIYAGPNHIEIGKGGVLRVRASQFKTDPVVSRVVVDLAKEQAFNAVLSDDNRYFSLGVEKGDISAPQEARPAKLKKEKILRGKVIVIDPGHGGSDPGAFGASGDRVKEKDLNLATAKKLIRMLSDAGAVPFLSREEDAEISLAGRVEFARNNKADILICMHYNSSFRSDISGTETYYYNPNSKLLASLIHRDIVSELGRQDRGLAQVKFYVIYNSPMPSVLVEPVYLSNSDEERLATDADFQEKVAKAIFDGIKQYFEVLKKIG